MCTTIMWCFAVIYRNPYKLRHMHFNQVDASISFEHIHTGLFFHSADKLTVRFDIADRQI